MVVQDAAIAILVVGVAGCKKVSLLDELSSYKGDDLQILDLVSTEPISDSGTSQGA